MSTNPAVQITSITLHQSGAIRLPDNDPVYVRLVCDRLDLHKTAVSRVHANKAWKEWQDNVNVSATQFIVCVMRRRRFRADLELGSVTVSMAKFSTREANHACVKTFRLFMTNRIYTIDVTLSFLGLRPSSMVNKPTIPAPGHVPGRVDSSARVEEGNKGLETRPTRRGTIDTALDSADDVSRTVTYMDESLQYMDAVVSLVKAFQDLHPIAKGALVVLTTAYDLVRKQTQRDAGIRELAISMRDMLSSLAAVRNLVKNLYLQSTVRSAIEMVHGCAEFINAYSKHGFWGRFVRQSWTSQTAISISLFQKSFDDLKDKLDRGVGIQALETAENVERHIISTEDNALLDKLPRTEHAYSDVDLKCLEGTRQDVLQSIFLWIDRMESHRNVFWLNAIAGSGKTTIASTVAAMLEPEKGALQQLHLGSLGAAFFCKRDDEKLRQPQLVWTTIAFRLAHACPTLRGPILEAVRSNPDVGRSPIVTQFRRLIVEPLSSLHSPDGRDGRDGRDLPPIVIIIDALDECGNSSTRDPLLRCLVEHSSGLPSWLKILITSRPEDDVKHSLVSIADSQQLDISSEQQRADVAAYISHRVQALTKDRTLAQNWAGIQKTASLVAQADGLFIWARLSLDYIEKQPSPEVAVNLVLSDVSTPGGDGPYNELDHLYRTVLLQAVSQDMRYIPLICHVLGAIVVAKVPLSMANLCRLIPNDKHDSSAVKWAIGKLASVLPVQPSGVIRVLHPSFVDFLTTKSRSQDFHIATSEYNTFMARACLRFMLDNLQHDICQAGNPSLLNAEILVSREVLAGKGPLIYCCQYWTDHVVGSHCLNDDDVVKQVKMFFSERLLEWLEVLSLADTLEQGFRCLYMLQAALRSRRKSKDLKAISLGCHDAIRFMRYHFRLIRQSALHIYISALAFTPSNSWIAETYIKKYTLPLRIPVGLDRFWSRCLLVVDRHEDSVRAARFSPDGRQVASGSEDGFIHVWDTETGLICTSLYQDGWNEVSSISFSPDGRSLAMGSFNSILVWNLQTGDLERQLDGHSDDVMSVAWSPDGQHIVSGGLDKRIIVWDAAIGTEIISLQSHTSEVTSLDFSLDGQRLASGSFDAFVHIWDTKTWKQIDSLEVRGYVTAVAFSPDGRRLAWCSIDNEVGLWDIGQGTTSQLQICRRDKKLSKPSTVAFSHDGKYLAVGSSRSDLTVWDMGTNKLLREIEGHGGAITEVAFSRTNSGILLSCSHDKTVRLWDIETADLSGWTGDEAPWDVYFSPDGKYLVTRGAESFLRCTETGEKRQLDHSDEVRMLKVAFSPNGKQLATFATDKLIRLWDVEKGSILRTLEGQSRMMKTLTFSPSGTHIAAVSDLSSVWDIETGTRSEIKGSPSWIIAALPSPEPVRGVDSNLHPRPAYRPQRPNSASYFPQTTGLPDIVETVMEDDGWVFAEHQGTRVRLCYLPSLHRGPPYVSAGTRAATICSKGLRKVTIMDVSLLFHTVSALSTKTN